MAAESRECSALTGPFLKTCGVSGLFGLGGSRELRAVQVTEKCVYVSFLLQKKKKYILGFPVCCCVKCSCTSAFLK